MFFNKSKSSNYRIVKIGEQFIAEAKNNVNMWWMIEDDGSTGVTRRSLPNFAEMYLVDTEEEAGNRINKRSSLVEGGDIIWKG